MRLLGSPAWLAVLLLLLVVVVFTLTLSAGASRTPEREFFVFFVWSTQNLVEVSIHFVVFA